MFSFACSIAERYAVDPSLLTIFKLVNFFNQLDTVSMSLPSIKSMTFLVIKSTNIVK